MKRNISNITLTKTSTQETLSDFFVPSSVTYKRTVDRDGAGRFEILELSGRLASDDIDDVATLHDLSVQVDFDDSSSVTFGSADFPARVTVEETEGETTFKIRYEKPL